MDNTSKEKVLKLALRVFGVIFLFTGVIMIGPVVVPLLVRGLAWPLRKLTPVEGRIAADNARANPTRTASTASGLMIGVALVAAIGSIGSSFIGTISDDLDKELKTDFTIQPRGAQGGPQSSIAESALAKVQALCAHWRNGYDWRQDALPDRRRGRRSGRLRDRPGDTQRFRKPGVLAGRSRGCQRRPRGGGRP